MAFTPSLGPPPDQDRGSYWFVFKDSKLLAAPTGAAAWQPYLDYRPVVADTGVAPIYLGLLDGVSCYGAWLPEDADPPAGLALVDLRRFLGRIDDTMMQAAGYARQLVHWTLSHRYCGRCGRPTESKPSERAMVCNSCGQVNFPQITPAVIVAVVRGNRLLLARSARFRKSFYSVLAGYVEPGETLEACIRREVREEVGIEIRNIAYFGSQPWPFPSSLMVAFTAEHAAGDIRIDPSEIIAADWYSADSLPDVPGIYSIAGQLIEWFVQQQSGRPIFSVT